MKTLGMDYKMYHACQNDCILFKGAHINAQTCPECGESRFKAEDAGAQNNKVPRKILRHFLIIPRLRHIMQCPSLAQYMDWHSRHRSIDNIWRIPADCKAFKHIDAMWPAFRDEPRNLKCGIAMDGINPFGMQSTSWSTWPVVLVNYNIPPFMAIKKEHLLLSLLIPGTSCHFNLLIFLHMKYLSTHS